MPATVYNSYTAGDSRHVCNNNCTLACTLTCTLRRYYIQNKGSLTLHFLKNKESRNCKLSSYQLDRELQRQINITWEREAAEHLRITRLESLYLTVTVVLYSTWLLYWKSHSPVFSLNDLQLFSIGFLSALSVKML